MDRVLSNLATIRSGGVLRKLRHDSQSSCPTGAVTEDTIKSHGLFNLTQTNRVAALWTQQPEQAF